MVERIRKDPYFQPILNQLDDLLDPATFVGRAPEQVLDFLQEEVKPVLDLYKDMQVKPVELNI